MRLNEKAIGGVFDSYRWWSLTPRQQELYMDCLDKSNGYSFTISKSRFSWVWKKYHRDEIELVNDLQKLIYEGFIICRMGHPYSDGKSKYSFSDGWKRLDEKKGLREPKRPVFLGRRYR